MRQKQDRKNRVRKRRVVRRFHGMKYSWKGHKDKRRHNLQNEKAWASPVGLCRKHKLQHLHQVKVSPWGLMGAVMSGLDKVEQSRTEFFSFFFLLFHAFSPDWFIKLKVSPIHLAKVILYLISWERKIVNLSVRFYLSDNCPVAALLFRKPGTGTEGRVK